MIVRKYLGSRIATLARGNVHMCDFHQPLAYGHMHQPLAFVSRLEERNARARQRPPSDRMIGNARARQCTHGRLASGLGTCAQNVSIPCLGGQRLRCRRLLKPGLPGRVVCNSTSRPRQDQEQHEQVQAPGKNNRNQVQAPGKDVVRACGHDQEQQEQVQGAGKDVARALPASGSDAGDRQGAQSVNRRWKKTFLFFFFVLVNQFHSLYDQLERSSVAHFEEIGVFDHVGVADWHLLQRAGLDSRRHNGTVPSKPRSLARDTGNPQLLTEVRSKADSKGSFFLDVAVLGATLMVPIRTGVWREDVMQRLLRTQLPEYLCLELCAADWRQDGRPLVEEYPVAKLIDSTLRLVISGLRGGMPPKKKIKPDQLMKKELRAAYQGRIPVDAASSTASSSQRAAEPLAGSELEVLAQQAADKPVEEKSYDSMTLAEMQACCGRKHGNSISTQK